MTEQTQYNVVFDNPWGEHPNFVTVTEEALIESIEERYGTTADTSSTEALAKQWCELAGFGFVRVIEKSC